MAETSLGPSRKAAIRDRMGPQSCEKDVRFWNGAWHHAMMGEIDFTIIGRRAS